MQQVLTELAEAAERFVNKAPNQTRLETNEWRCLTRSGKRNCSCRLRSRTACREAGNANPPVASHRGDQRFGSPSKSRA